MALSSQRAERLRPLFEQLVSLAEQDARVGFDPVEFPRKFSNARDVEVVALLSASLAYGRADLFRPKIAEVLSLLGPQPATRLQTLTVEESAGLFRGFVYRFNVPADLAVLLLGIGAALREFGSLEALFLKGLQKADLKRALTAFTANLRQLAPLEDIRRLIGPNRGLAHLLPSSDGAGASKRLHLYLRWMVRGPDSVDLGVWKNVSPAILMVPVDTHVSRLARRLGLTSRRTETWKMSEDITQAFRKLDAADPTRFDFALCHFGMSGKCPPKVNKTVCQGCLLRNECKVGRLNQGH